jgi:hypothetical protein
MQPLEIFVNFLTVVLGLITFYLFKNYWPKYFEAKATNQATKEDIGDITEIVENIKSDLMQQNELLKAQLSFKNQHRLNLKTAEREAIIEYNKRISAWVYSLIRFTLSGYNIDNFKELKQMSVEFSKRQYECDLAEAHLFLFMHDKVFLELKRDLTISVIELEGIVEQNIHKVYGTFSKASFELDREKENFGRQLEIRGQLYKEVDSLLGAHRKDSMEQFAKVHDIQSRMTQLINKRLKQLEEEEKNMSS